MKLFYDDNTLKLEYKNITVFSNTMDEPFITFKDWGLNYNARGGQYAVSSIKGIHAKMNILDIRKNTEKDVIIDFYPEDWNRSELLKTADTVVLRIRFTEKHGYLRMDLKPEGEGSYCFNFSADADEAFFGGGAQYKKINLKGSKITNIVEQHISKRNILSIITDSKEKRVTTDDTIPTSAPVSTYISSKNYAIKFNASSYGYADFTEPNKSSFMFDKTPSNISFFVADSLEELAEVLNKDNPSGSYLPAWANNGVILSVYGGKDNVLNKVNTALEAGVKIAAILVSDWCGPLNKNTGIASKFTFEPDEELYPDFKDMVSELNQKGVKTLIYLAPYLQKGSQQFSYCMEKGLLLKNFKGSAKVIKSASQTLGFLDLTNPESFGYFKDVIKNILSLGVSGWLADYHGNFPFVCKPFDGNPIELHNEWATLWAKYNREAIADADASDIFFIAKSAYNGTQSYAPVIWSGEQLMSWRSDFGLGGIIPGVINMGFSGLPLVHIDAGGHFSVLKFIRDKELFVRWLELSAISPLFRISTGGNMLKNIQFDSPEVIDYVVALSNLHAKIQPYIQDVIAEAGTGKMAIKPDFYITEDITSHSDNNAYYFGKDMFFAPVVTKGTETRTLHIAEGTWINIFTKEELGTGIHTVPAPLGQPAVFYRKGCKYEEIFAGI